MARANSYAVVTACTVLCATFVESRPAEALTFNFGRSPQVTDPTSLTYTDGAGTTLQFLNPQGTPQGANNPTLNANVNGVCAKMTFGELMIQGNAIYCGQNPTGVTGLPGGKTLDTIQFRFDRDQVIKSFTVAAVGFQNPASPDATPQNPAGSFPGGQAGTGTVTFTPIFTSSAGTISQQITIDTTRNAGANITFLNSNPQAPCIETSGSPAGSRCTINLSEVYRVNAGTLVTVSTGNFSAVSSEGFGSLSDPGAHWRLFGLETVDVPGPLPILGGAAAFGWSRRLRARLANAGNRNNTIS